MNTFYEHHNIKVASIWPYRCFDRILLNGLIQPFQQPERVIGFFNAYRNAERVTRNCLCDIAQHFQNWLKNRCGKWGVSVLNAPEGRRDDFVDPYFKQAKTDEVVLVLKARESARIMIAIGSEDRWHLQLAQRWILQYNFYINDQRWGRMFVRMSPYLHFSARVCLNQHHWLAKRLLSEGVDFKQCSNAFLKCSDPRKLQQLADSLTVQDLLSCGQKWLACLTPFFKESERKEAGCQNRLFFSQVEYCDNLIFHRRAVLDQLGQRLLDGSRTIGQPKKITMILGRKITKVVYECQESDHVSKVALNTRGARAVHKTRRLSAILGSCLPLPECQDLTFKGGRWKSPDMNVSLPVAMEEFVRQKVAIGDYETASEVVREGLRLLKQRDEVWKADVRDKVKQGMDSIRAGRTVPAEQVQAEMTAFKKKWKKNRNLK
jgi:putative addiction module CopG family antidote